MKKIALDVRPFTRVIWRSKEVKTEWESKLREASRVYYLAEWKMVSERLRKCGTVHVNKMNYEQVLNLLVQDGLFFKPITRTARYQGFSHKHITPKAGEDYDVYGVIASKREDALQFAKLSESRSNSMHMEIGDLLGYPRCCSDAFTKRWSEGSIDPLFEAASEVVPIRLDSDTEVITLDRTPIETNQMLRYFGLRTTSHLPCSLECKETIKMAEGWRDVMKKVDTRAHQSLEELLRLPLRWDAYRGILIVTTPIFKGVTTTGFTENKKIIQIGDLDW